MINEASLSSVQGRIESALRRTGQSTTTPIEIVAITKGFPLDAIISAVELGLTSIGENRVQEAEEKFAHLPELPPIKLRFVGHLQSNKARLAVELFDTIDSVDSVKLARRLSRIGKKKEVPVEVLLQVNVDQDPAKSGFDPEKPDELLEIVQLKGLTVSGLMTIGVFTTDEPRKRETFRALWEFRDSINGQLPQSHKLKHLSMGMSDDYEIAIEEGATMVRIGTALFGPRPKR